MTQGDLWVQAHDRKHAGLKLPHLNILAFSDLLVSDSIVCLTTSSASLQSPTFIGALLHEPQRSTTHVTVCIATFTKCVRRWRILNGQCRARAAAHAHPYPRVGLLRQPLPSTQHRAWARHVRTLGAAHKTSFCFLANLLRKQCKEL